VLFGTDFFGLDLFQNPASMIDLYKNA